MVPLGEKKIDISMSCRIIPAMAFILSEVSLLWTWRMNKICFIDTEKPIYSSHTAPTIYSALYFLFLMSELLSRSSHQKTFL